jgi:hypothetical protein
LFTDRDAFSGSGRFGTAWGNAVSTRRNCRPADAFNDLKPRLTGTHLFHQLVLSRSSGSTSETILCNAYGPDPLMTASGRRRREGSPPEEATRDFTFEEPKDMRVVQYVQFGDVAEGKNNNQKKWLKFSINTQIRAASGECGSALTSVTWLFQAGGQVRYRYSFIIPAYRRPS